MIIIGDTYPHLFRSFASPKKAGKNGEPQFLWAVEVAVSRAVGEEELDHWPSAPRQPDPQELANR